MLPQPVTTYRPKSRQAATSSHGHAFSSSLMSAGPGIALSSASHSLIDRLRGRARLTNLAVALILTALSLSLLVNLNVYLLSHDPDHGALHSGLGSFGGSGASYMALLTGGRGNTHSPPSIEHTIDRPSEIKGLEHLVIVAGHAIWTGHDPDRRDHDDQWVLTPFQRGGSVKTFYKHIEAGAKLALQDPSALLVFSGGQTRPDNPPATEGQSYHALALATGLLPPAPGFLRATTEDFALDSFENVLFSLARFREVTGRWPARVTVVGFEMKRARFENLHRTAIKYPAENFHYIGIDDEGDNQASYEGEYQYGFLPFQDDMYACLPPLSTKRTSRNPFARYHPYHISAPEIAGLLEWCPPSGRAGQGTAGIYPGHLSWEQPLLGHGDTKWGRESD